MKRAVVIVILILAIAALSGTLFWFTSEDPRYQIQEWLSHGRYDQYDATILEAAFRYGTEPELIKAIIWRESRFHPLKVGNQGERGLMQVTERAATDWIKAEKIATFMPTDLFDPKVNIEAGTWYVSRALNHWAGKDDPVPFALAEYNAGRGRVIRWMKDAGQGTPGNVNDLRAAMDFPGTKSYIAAIMARADFYKRRAEFETSPKKESRGQETPPPADLLNRDPELTP